MLSEPRKGRRVPVIVYVCTSDPDTADLIADHCRRYAEGRDWPVTDTVTDTDRQQPLEQRPGWSSVIAALGDAASGVLTYSPLMVAADSAGFERLRTLTGDRGAFLVAVRTATTGPDTLPRRTAQDSERRRNLADAAAGVHPHSPYA
ncbi:hypothetical protein ACODT5_28695 [Streptomyces sp. 5.8]|uniref:hypothetical protein n=1 Tax=Streptomyces sp. 5.8 TaxID=3406571 RepID=UPI003BB6C8A1